MKRLSMVVILVIAACSPAESEATSSTSSSSTTSSLATTTSQAATSTSSTTSTTMSTTTTSAPGSTTTSVLAGNWADEPLITTDFGALGWWSGTSWLEAEDQGALPVVGGEDYQVIVGNNSSRTTGGPQTTVCEPLGLIGVELADPRLLGSFPGPYGVAISAPWPLQPHLFATENDDGTYAQVARQLLAGRGLDVPNPVVKQVIRTDLEGDGVNEILVAAEDVTPGFLLEQGDYSIVFMNKVVAGGVQTSTLEETVVLGPDDEFAGVHSIGTVADLNGDGKMEIVISSSYFEGFGVSVWEYVEGEFGPILRLATGCGS